MKKKIIFFTSVFFSLILFFFSAMVLVHCIPKSAIKENAEESLQHLVSEGAYPIPYDGASQLDNFTDKLMVGMNTEDIQTEDPLYLAMFNPTFLKGENYSRYWHGYQVFLRPMLVLFSIVQIRQIMTLLFFSLICLNFLMLWKKLTFLHSFAFLVTMICLSITVVGVSLQFFSVFAIMLFFNLYLFAFTDISKAKYISVAFMAVGMITNFLDLLTAPLLTLGVPLIIYIALLYKTGETRWLEGFKKIIFSSVAWVMGYGLCWVSKWALASIVLKQNIFSDAFHQILFRTNGNEEYAISRINAVYVNILRLLSENGTFLIVMAAVIVLAVLMIIFKAKRSDYKTATLFVVIALFPVIWYFVLANHSSIHSWFTFRAAGIGVFAMLTALASVVNTELFSKRLNNIAKRFHGLINKL